MHVDAPRVDVPFHCRCDARITIFAQLTRGRWLAEVEGNVLRTVRGQARTFTTADRAYSAAAGFIAATKAKEDARAAFNQKEARVEKLPKTFQGAEVVRGEGMNADELDAFLERRAMDSFVATADMWIVVEDKALEDIDDSVEVKGFDNKSEAVRYAQARSKGNVDHRVLRVTEQVLVVATMNDL